MPIFPRAPLTRRAALTGLAAAPATVAFGSRSTANPPSADRRPNRSSCVETSPAIEGPYYFDAKLDRSDITEGRAGAPLLLRFTVIEAQRCAPLIGARLDVWHASATGVYSGYRSQGDERSDDTVGQTFMRGSQRTDEHGDAGFMTVYPGWYEGRTAHIHFKVFVDDREILTGQMYFPDALSEFIYQNVNPYKTRKRKRDTFNSSDFVADMDKNRSGYCDIREEADHYLASLVIVASLAGAELKEDAHLPPPPPGFGGPPPGFGAPPPGFGPLGQPPRRGPSIIVPGVTLADQQHG